MSARGSMAAIATRLKRSPRRQAKRTDDYALESAKRLLDVLVHFGAQGGDHTISGLGRELGLTFSRTYRLVATLEAKGFVERDPSTGRYRIGLRALEVGMRYLRDHGLIAEARTQLEDLVAESSETAFLAIRDASEIVYVDRVDSPQVVRFQTAIGSRAPWQCVAAGLALVSAEPSAVLEELLAQPLAPCAGAGSTRAQLRRALTAARETGYAVNFGMWHEDVGAVASPIVDAAGRPRAALVLGAPLARFTRQRANQLGQLVRERATRVRLA